MRLCSYIITVDSGLAPNPFWDYCTLAVCTPNHQDSISKEGDWFVGISSKSRGNKLIYAMQVSEKMNFDEYYHDPRFFEKRPKKGSWKERCGDNMYFKDKKDEWKQQNSVFCHDSKEERNQDLKHPIVFIAKKFYYFGGNSIEIPFEFQDIVRKRQGIKCSYIDELVKEFLHWLQDEFEVGVYGNPLDKENQKICQICG